MWGSITEHRNETALPAIFCTVLLFPLLWPPVLQLPARPALAQPIPLSLSCSCLQMPVLSATTSAHAKARAASPLIAHPDVNQKHFPG